MRKIFSWISFPHFFIAFLLAELVFSIAFLQHFADDFSGKLIPAEMRLGLLQSILVSAVIPSVMVAYPISIIYGFKRSFRSTTFSFWRQFALGLLSSSGLAVIVLLFSNTVVPNAQRELRKDLYIIKISEEGELKPDDGELTQLFDSQPQMIGIHHIDSIMNELEAKIEDEIAKCDSLLALLPDSLANMIYERSRLEQLGIGLPKENRLSITKQEEAIRMHSIGSISRGVKMDMNTQKRLIREKSQRIAKALLIFALFIFGASIGYYFNDQKGFLLIVLMLFLGQYFERALFAYESSREGSVLGIDESMLVPLVLIFGMSLIFLAMAIYKREKSKNRPSDQSLIDG